MISNFFYNFIKTFVGICFPLISFSYASRVLGVDSIGRVQYSTSVISYFSMIACLGIATYAVREGSKYKGKKKELGVFTIELFIISTISTLCTFALFIIYLMFFCEKEYIILMLISSFSIIGTVYSFDWIYQIEEDYKYITSKAVLVQLFAIIMMFVFVRDSNDYVIYAFVCVLGSCGSFVFNIYNAKKYVNIEIVKKNIHIKKHIRPILIIWGAGLATSIYMNLDMVMLKHMESERQLGYYTTSVKLAQVVKVLVTSFSNVLIPRMSYYVGIGDFKKHKNVLSKNISVITMIAIPLCIGLFSLSDKMIIIFSGKEFLFATRAARILSMNVVFSVLNGVLFYQVLLPYKKELYASVCTMIGAILNFFANLILIPIFSYEGAALTTLLSEMSVFVLLMIVSRKYVLGKKVVFDIVKYIVLALPILLISFLVEHIVAGCFFSILLSVAISVIVYFLELVLLKDKNILAFLKMKTTLGV